jgi:predicted RNA methylase
MSKRSNKGKRGEEEMGGGVSEATLPKGDENVVVTILETPPHPSIFPNAFGVDKSKLQITNVGQYSVSKVDGAIRLVQLLAKYFKTKDITITDGTANNGSDTIMLALNFKHVNAIEKHPTEFSVLKNNVKAYGLKNVTLINADTNVALPTLTQTVIYIDAPWGGTDYKEKECVRLYMSNHEISDIYNENKERARLFVFKVPINYDFNYFIRNTKQVKYYIHSYERHGHVKYHFLFVPAGRDLG